MKIGFIGLGLMGRGMANNLLKAGYELVLHDLDKSAATDLLQDGAEWSETAKGVGNATRLVFTSLPTPLDVERVGDELLESLDAGAVWFDLSTNGVKEVRALHEKLTPFGIDFLDAPVSGGPSGAKSGQLAMWVGGSETSFRNYDNVLAHMADQRLYLGEIGAGSIAKLCHNLSSTVMMQAIGEAMTIGVKAGLNPLKLYEALRAGATGRARSYDSIHKRWLADTLDPATFQLRLLHKDVGLAVQLARDADVPARLSQLAFEEMTEALNCGWGHLDAQTVIELQRQRAGLQPFQLTQTEIDEVMGKS